MLFLRPIGGNIGRNELLDLGGGGGTIGGTGRTYAASTSGFKSREKRT